MSTKMKLNKLYLFICFVLLFNSCSNSSNVNCNNVYEISNVQIKEIFLTHPYFSDCLSRNRDIVLDSIIKYRRCYNIKESKLTAAVTYISSKYAHDIETKIISIYDGKNDCYTIPLTDDYYYLIQSDININNNSNNCNFNDCFVFEKKLNYLLNNSSAFQVNQGDSLFVRQRIFALIDFLLVEIENEKRVSKLEINNGFLNEHKKRFFEGNDLNLKKDKIITANYKRISDNVENVNYRYYANFQGFYEIKLVKGRSKSYNLEIDFLNKEYYYFPSW